MDLARFRGRSSGVMFIAAGFFLLLGAWLMIDAERAQDILYGFSTSFTALVFLVLGVRHDFSRWQIEQRRFGGFMEYLRGVKKNPSGNSLVKTGSNPDPANINRKKTDS